MQVRLQRGIPLPPSTNGGRPLTYPWLTMKVGESFLTNRKGSAHDMVWRANKKYAPRFFVGRKTKLGYRVWRAK